MIMLLHGKFKALGFFSPSDDTIYYQILNNCKLHLPQGPLIKANNEIDSHIPVKQEN